MKTLMFLESVMVLLPFMHLADTYPKRLTVHSGYTFFNSMCVSWELNPQPFALLTQCSTTEPLDYLASFTIPSSFGEEKALLVFDNW